MDYKCTQIRRYFIVLLSALDTNLFLKNYKYCNFEGRSLTHNLLMKV